MGFRRVLIVFLASVLPASASMIREPGSMYDISAPMSGDGDQSWPDVWDYPYLDDVESLSVGPLDGQMNEHGQTWFSFDATVEDPERDQLISQTNTFADNFFLVEVSTTLPPTSGVFAFSVDSALSDLRTGRFYTPVDNTIGQIFTRVGDANGDGEWDVLQLDESGSAYFAETGFDIPYPSPFELEIVVKGSELQVFVDGGWIFSGSVIDTTMFGGPGRSSTLTSANFESANNAGGERATATYDNIGILIPEPSTLLFFTLGASVLLTGFRPRASARTCKTL